MVNSSVFRLSEIQGKLFPSVISTKTASETDSAIKCTLSNLQMTPTWNISPMTTGWEKHKLWKHKNMLPKGWMPCPWRYPRPGWMGFWAILYRCPCSFQVSWAWLAIKSLLQLKQLYRKIRLCKSLRLYKLLELSIL